MTLVRLLFIAMFAVHVVGVPAAAVSPCAAGGPEAHGCCMRHQTVTGGYVIGSCGCLAAPESTDRDAVVSVPVPPSGSPAQIVLTAGVEARALRSTDAGSFTVHSSPTGPGPSPPRLSGAGFRC
jgi:hypothetical protein